MPDDVLLGFDATGTDVTVIVMGRTPGGTWRLVDAGDPPSWVADHVADLIGRHPIPPPPSWATAAPLTLEKLQDCIDAIRAQQFTVDAEQASRIRRMLEDPRSILRPQHTAPGGG